MKNSFRIYQKEDVKLVQLRYYEKDKGLLVMDNPSYAIVHKNERTGMYDNCVNIGESFPMFTRSPYPCEIDGEVYGYKVYDNKDVEESTIVYLDILKEDFIADENTEIISSSQINDFILKSNLYFKDRELIARDNIRHCTNVIQSAKVLHKDYNKNIETRKFIEEAETEKYAKRMIKKAGE